MSGLKVGEAGVLESEMQQLKAQVRELQRMLGKKTQVVEVLRDATALAREKAAVAGSIVEAERHAVSAAARVLGVSRFNQMRTPGRR
ncbi:hypothetical protein HV824_32380 [Myxococcus sp. AM009]|uniref:hypothetical protein n=1 Tax=Myxococcus sp. AM009 TaxID=2745137 RepID=UPI00159533D9|nr:hypothetical protein [Myxococcus sp. AM009]NVJ02792.1 hypothetical protein [Myxococcus sp. AM009]